MSERYLVVPDWRGVCASVIDAETTAVKAICLSIEAANEIAAALNASAQRDAPTHVNWDNSNPPQLWRWSGTLAEADETCEPLERLEHHSSVCKRPDEDASAQRDDRAAERADAIYTVMHDMADWIESVQIAESECAEVDERDRERLLKRFAALQAEEEHAPKTN